MQSLKDLLGDSLRRNHITSQVTTARLIEEANRILVTLLPEGRSADAHAHAYRDGVLSITCVNAPAAHRIQSCEKALLDQIVRALPAADVRAVKTVLVQRFSSDALY